jgi:four helix bundle protein
MAFTHEKLVVWQESVIFVRWASEHLIPKFRKSSSSGLGDQLSRASTSISLNIAEGCSRWHRKDKKHFYQIAMGSTAECASIVRLAAAVGAVASDDGEVVVALAQLNKIAAWLVNLMGSVTERSS